MEYKGFHLDKEQEMVVKEKENSLIIAGAGCGKTFTICAKAEYEIKNNEIPANELVFLSFTNASTEDLQNKLSTISNDLRAYTFHSYALSIINKELEDFSIDVDYSEYRKIILDFLKNKIFLYNEIFCLLYKYYIEDHKEHFKAFYSWCGDTETYYDLLIYEYTWIQLLIERMIQYRTFSRKEEKFGDKTNKAFLIFEVLYKNIMLQLKDIPYDYDDFIQMAIQKLDDLNIHIKIQKIFVDEYQDISYDRMLFLQKIVEKTNCKIYCFGDDFQAIYHFAGGSLEYFLHFNRYFKNSKLHFIRHTYRNKKQLIYISTHIVLINKCQIKKTLLSSQSLSYPIHLYSYQSREEERNKFYSLLKKLNHFQKEIMVLSRYQKSCDLLEGIFTKSLLNEREYHCELFPNLKISYYTMHSSKGLEAQEVILLDVSSKKEFSFPSTQEDSPYFKTAYSKLEEERRLLYVALSRTKNHVYIFYDKENESSFIREIKYAIFFSFFFS